MINVGYWMTRVREIAEVGGDCISEINEVRAVASIPLVNQAYYANKIFTGPAKTIRYFKNADDIRNVFLTIKDDMDVLHIRGNEPFHAIRPYTSSPIIFFGSPMDEKAYAECQAVEVFAPCWRQWLIEDYNIPPEKIFTIPQAVDLNVFRPMDVAELKKQYGCSHILGYVGSTQETYLRVDLNRYFGAILDRYPDTLFMICTQSMEKNKYLRFCQRVLDRVLIHNVPWDDIPKYYNMFDVCLCLGTAPYAGNMKEVEAQACGTPVIAFNLENRQYRMWMGHPGLVDIENLPDYMLRKNPKLRMENPDYNMTDLINRTLAFMDNEQLRKDTIAKQLENVQRFSIENVGKMIEDMYHKIGVL